MVYYYKLDTSGYVKSIFKLKGNCTEITEEEYYSHVNEESDDEPTPEELIEAGKIMLGL